MWALLGPSRIKFGHGKRVEFRKGRQEMKMYTFLNELASFDSVRQGNTGENVCFLYGQQAKVHVSQHPNPNR